MVSTWSACCVGFSQKWIFAIMAFFGLWIGNGLRVILSITITEMVSIHEVARHLDDTCGGPEEYIPKNVTTVSGNVYNWDEYTQGIILSSYFWGYAVTQFPFGTLSERFGGKHLLGLGVLIPSVLTFLTPLAIEWGEDVAMIVLRVTMGVTSGAIYPAVSTMISQWTTPCDRAKIGSVVYAGAILGTVFGTTLPAIIIRYSGMGWPAVFYVFGAVGILWFPFWMLMCYNNPEEHPYISEAEFKYLQEGRQKCKNKLRAPWKHIFTSKQFWAFVIAMIGCDWAYFTMASDLPKYMSRVVRFSIEDNGYLSSLPYLCMWFNTLFSSWITDQLISRNLMARTNVRKLLTSVALIGPGTFIVAASYAKCNQILVVFMFIFGMTLMGSAYPSIMVNALDLSPNYAGTLMAIGNGIAALGGVFTPYVVGILTPNQTLTEWRFVFWIVFGISVLSNVYFLVYGSGDVQEWNEPDFKRDKHASPMEEVKKKVVDLECARF